MDGLTKQVGAFASSVGKRDIPADCMEGARIGITDCISVLLAGSKEEAPAIVGALLEPSAKDDAVPHIPSGRKFSVGDAALLNGVSAHVLDYDDVALAGHPSVVLTPAILAEGWALNKSGAEVLAAYVAGYEVWALLYDLEPGSLHELGFHPTAVNGTLACAAACASLRGLSKEQASHAVAISASLASGMVANFGSMTKSLQTARAAQSGVLAARLASAGYTASLDVLEHRTGYVRAHSPSRAPRLDIEDFRLGIDWRLPKYGVHIKRYPLCYATHRSIDAALELVKENDIAPADIREIHVHTGETQYLMLRNHFPQTGLEAKFSMEFAMASAVVAKRVGLGELTDEFVTSGPVRAVMQKVRCTTTTEVVTDWDQPFAPADTVSITLASGRVLTSEPVARPKGSWQRRMTQAELQDKFVDCASRVLPKQQAIALFAQLSGLGGLASIRDLSMFVVQG
ncbi:MmgE/PrpD family protein [Paraburkholderia lycopersici]|nr:MmgE/PrpD family protein [Paraburkholderia lycopersici]